MDLIESYGKQVADNVPETPWGRPVIGQDYLDYVRDRMREMLTREISELHPRPPHVEVHSHDDVVYVDVRVQPMQPVEYIEVSTVVSAADQFAANLVSGLGIPEQYIVPEMGLQMREFYGGHVSSPSAIANASRIGLRSYQETMLRGMTEHHMNEVFEDEYVICNTKSPAEIARMVMEG